MADSYAAFAAEASRAIQTLLDDTGVRLRPAVQLLACDSGRNAHYVAAESLERHLWKCHGEKRPRPVVNAAFYYRSTAAEKTQQEEVNMQLEADSDEAAAGELCSLLEPESLDEKKHTAEIGIGAAIAGNAISAGEFYARVHAWKKIPRAFALVQDAERDLVMSSALRRWLHAELSRPGVLPSGDTVEEELVEYIAGLLEHPDFCHPDLLVLELHEFLGTSVTGFVLALWKFLVVEIGLNSVYLTEKSTINNSVRGEISSDNNAAHAQSTAKKVLHTFPRTAEEVTAHDYKRRRASYKKNVGTKTGLAAFREMIQTHMIGLSMEADRDLALGGGFDDKKEHDNASQAKQRRPEPLSWYRFTDALEVRNRSRPGRRGSTSREGRRSRSQSAVERDRLPHDRRSYRKTSRSPDRRGRRSQERRRRRSRSLSHDRRRSSQRDSERYLTKRSASRGHDRDRSRHLRRSDDRHR